MNDFSIIVPLHNGWPYVEECITSILSQTYPNFNILILENCSDDQTNDYLDKIEDERVKVFRSSRELSIEENWKRAIELEKNQYMTLLGHDDLLDPKCLETINQLIEANPEANLFYTSGNFIDENGSVIRNLNDVPNIENASDYLKRRFKLESDISATGYFFKSLDFERIGGMPPIEGLFYADDTLFLKLIGDGYKAATNSHMYSIRLHKESASASQPSKWKVDIKALVQFDQFLQDHRRDHPDINKVYNEYSLNFFKYAFDKDYIYALIEASTRGRSICASDKDEILKALIKCSNDPNISLSSSLKAKIIERLNQSFLRMIVPSLWKIYCSVS